MFRSVEAIPAKSIEVLKEICEFVFVQILAVGGKEYLHGKTELSALHGLICATV
jgi:hypothetical protein